MQQYLVFFLFIFSFFGIHSLNHSSLAALLKDLEDGRSDDEEQEEAKDKGAYWHLVIFVLFLYRNSHVNFCSP